MRPRTPMLLMTLMILGASLPERAEAKLQIVTSHADLAAISKAVGGDRVAVTNLCEPTQDPHFVDARPNLMLAINRADLVIVVGLELEVGWLPSLLTGARNPKVLPGQDGYLDTSAFVKRREIPKGTVDRSQGDIHPGGNPHFSRDPRSGIAIASGIARRLGRLDPDGASAYRRGYARFERELDVAMKRWANQLAPHKGTELVGYHKSWTYFAEWLGLKIDLFVEPKPGIPPHPAHVASLLKLMRARKVKAILQEEYYPDRTARLLATKTGAKLLKMPGGTHIRRGETYLAYVERQIKMLLEALGPPPAGAQP